MKFLAFYFKCFDIILRILRSTKWYQIVWVIIFITLFIMKTIVRLWRNYVKYGQMTSLFLLFINNRKRSVHDVFSVLVEDTLIKRMNTNDKIDYDVHLVYSWNNCEIIVILHKMSLNSTILQAISEQQKYIGSQMIMYTNI